MQSENERTSHVPIHPPERCSLDSDDEFAALCPTAGQFGLVLAEIQEVMPPIQIRGHQGIWEWKEAV